RHMNTSHGDTETRRTESAPRIPRGLRVSVPPCEFFLPAPLDSVGLRHGAVRGHVAGVERRRGLEQQHVDLFRSDWPMLDAARHDDELAAFDSHRAIAKLHVEAALENEEELVFILVVMPHELAAEFHQLDMLAVQLADDLGVEVRTEQRQLLPQ